MVELGSLLNKQGLDIDQSPVSAEQLVDPLFTDSWTFRDDQGEQVIRPGNVFQVNVAEAMAMAKALPTKSLKNAASSK